MTPPLSPLKQLKKILYLVILLLTISTTVQTAEASKAFLWKVQSQTATVYILGSVHFADQNLYPLDPAIEKAFAKSDNLVLEINPLTVDENAVQKYILKKGFYKNTETIADHTSDAVFKKLKNFINNHNMPAAYLYTMKPGLLALTLTTMQLTNLGYLPEYGIDLHFAQQAKDSKPILAIETTMEQLSLLLSTVNTDDFLLYTLMDLQNLELLMQQTIKAWKTGDSQEMTKLLIDPYKKIKAFRPFVRKLIDNRNIKMTARINKLLKSNQNSFVVVGAAHLLGEKGILTLLAKHNYTIEQLENEK